MQPTHPNYVPVLLTKRGELGAVEDLGEDLKNTLTPLFVAHPVEWNYEIDAPAKSVAEHAADLGGKLARAYGPRRAYFDPVFLVEDDEWRHEDSHPLPTVVNDAEAGGLRLIPVVSIGRHPSYIDSAIQVHREKGSGVCLRLSPGDWPANPPAILKLQGFLTEAGLEPAEVDLVLDASESGDNELVVGLAFSALSNLPSAGEWRSVTLTSGAFPKDLAGFQKNEITRFPRSDWQLWSRVRSGAIEEGWRLPTFGDYSVSHPDPILALDPRIMSISASLRYTAMEHWVVAKGGLFKGRGGTGSGGSAAVDVAKMIAGAPEFCGPSYSEGDRWIWQVAEGETNGGNPEKWRRVATNHHLTLVSGALSSLDGPGVEI